MSRKIPPKSTATCATKGGKTDPPQHVHGSTKEKRHIKQVPHIAQINLKHCNIVAVDSTNKMPNLQRTAPGRYEQNHLETRQLNGSFSNRNRAINLAPDSSRIVYGKIMI